MADRLRQGKYLQKPQIRMQVERKRRRAKSNSSLHADDQLMLSCNYQISNQTGNERFAILASAGSTQSYYVYTSRTLSESFHAWSRNRDTILPTKC
jgi:hypothetical protein